jgi:hypothetical protein
VGGPLLYISELAYDKKMKRVMKVKERCDLEDNIQRYFCQSHI